MAKSKHRRKGKTRPRGTPPREIPLPPPSPEEVAERERFRAFLAQTGRIQEHLSHADWHDTLESQEWRDWVAQHPLPADEDG